MGKKQPPPGSKMIKNASIPQVKVDRMSDAPKDETGMNNETARIEVGNWAFVGNRFGAPFFDFRGFKQQDFRIQGADLLPKEGADF